MITQLIDISFITHFKDSTRGEAYLTELIRQAQSTGLSMTMKSFDHAYDGANVYTYHPMEMAGLITNLYPRHVDAFYETEHFLRGPLDGVDSAHVGWVQEPGFSLNSHSSRMGVIGSVLDAEGLSDETYRAGCDAAGVLPDTPWLLNNDSLAIVQRDASQRG